MSIILYSLSSAAMWKPSPSGGGGGSWGSITGALGDQADLTSALNGKQGLDADLTALAALSTNGLIARSGAGTAAIRTLQAGSAKVTITNPGGVAGDPSIDVVEAQLALANIAGTLAIGKGGTGATTANAALNALLPTQTGNADKVLKTDGTNTSWVAQSGGAHTHPTTDITGLQTILNNIPQATVSTGSNATNSSGTTYVDITGLSFPVVSGTLYRLHVLIPFSSEVATTGIVLQMNSMPTMSMVALSATCMQTGVGGNAEFQGPLTAANGYTITFTGVAVADTDYLAEIKGVFQPSAAGTIQIRFRSEIDTTAITVKSGSVGLLSRPAVGFGTTFLIEEVVKTASFALTGSDSQKRFVCNGSGIVITHSGLSDGFECTILNRHASALVTVDGTVDQTIGAGEAATIMRANGQTRFFLSAPSVVL